MDTKAGILTIIDKQNNKIVINSEKKQIDIESAGDMNIKAAKSLSIDAKSISIDAKSLKIDATITNFKSNIIVSGQVIIKGILIVTKMIFGRIIRKVPFF